MCECRPWLSGPTVCILAGTRQKRACRPFFLGPVFARLGWSKTGGRMSFWSIDYFRTLARYNRWANVRLYGACLALPPDDYAADRRGYFKSIGNTLNHIYVGDSIWLARFKGQDNPFTDLSTIPFPDRDALWIARQALDEAIIAHFTACDAAQLLDMLSYRDTRGMTKSSPAPIAFGHFFNHQTHHRGQIHGMLSHAGIAEPPPLDFMY